jgi:hypothetical protein
LLGEQIDESRTLLTLILAPLHRENREAPKEEKGLGNGHPTTLEKDFTEAHPLERNHEEEEDNRDASADEKALAEVDVDVIAFRPTFPQRPAAALRFGLILEFGDLQTTGAGRALDRLAKVLGVDVEAGIAVWAGN